MHVPNIEKQGSIYRVLSTAGRSTLLASREQKAAALAHVLTSRTFQKSDLLIRFLRFVCEKELAGESTGITEYSIATEALGRSADFSPEADSSVRSRAHALRRKLEDCYREELQDATLRIVLPKGSYVPEFVAATTEKEAFANSPGVAPALQPAPQLETAPQPQVQKRSYSPLVIAFAAGIVATLLSSSLLHRGENDGNRNTTAESLAQAWGPLLAPNAEVLIVVGIPKQFWARDFTGLGAPRNEAWYPALPQDQPLQKWFFDNKPPSEERFILLHPNVGSPLWGDVAGALGAVKTLAAHGIRHQVLPERVLKPYALRGRNVLLFGNPEYSPAIRQLLQDAPFQVEYDPVSRWEAVFNHRPKPGEPEVLRRSRTEENLGVITVIAEEREDTRSSQIVVFSGLTSGGTQAAEEYFSSAGDLGDLGQRFRAEGIKGWPRSYQIVVEATTDTNLPIKHRYKAHRVLTR
jgi:hypothetical protein